MRPCALALGMVVLHLALPAATSRVEAEPLDQGSLPRPAASTSWAEARPLSAQEARRADRIARFRALGFPESRLEEFLGSGKGLTRWYNEVAIGGRDAMVAGWFLVALGAASIVAGSVLLRVERWQESKRASECFECDPHDDFPAAGIAALFCYFFGILDLLPGIPLAAWGTWRRTRWVKDDLYDRAPIDHLRQIRKVTEEKRARGADRRPPDAERRSQPSLAIAPYFTSGGGGLSLSLSF